MRQEDGVKGEFMTVLEDAEIEAGLPADPFGEEEEDADGGEAPTTAEIWQNNFHIDSDARMLWLQRKMALLDMEADLIEMQAKSMIEKLRAKQAYYMEKHGAEALEYARRRMQQMQKGKRVVKTWPTYYGDIHIQTTKEAAKIENPAEVWEALKEMGVLKEYTTEKLDTVKVQKFAYNHVKAGLEVLPGIKIVPENDRLKFKVKSGGVPMGDEGEEGVEGPENEDEEEG